MNPLSLPDSFYPTPPDLVRKMLDCIDFKLCYTFLEPSAGDGAIAWGIAERTYDPYHREGYSVDCIELDETLRALLRARFGPERAAEYRAEHKDLMAKLCESPVRVVHDDFFSFDCKKRYDAIIMNPPFENGDEHLQKALALMGDGGQVVCLLNAETIRNPYTARRQAVLGELKFHNASIHFLQGEFAGSDARRKTSVEVALINITFPHKKKPSFIFDSLKKAREDYPIEPPQSLMRMGDKVTEMVEQFDFETQCGIKIIHEYEALRPCMLKEYDEPEQSSCILTLTVGSDRNCTQACDVNAYLRVTRLKYWSALFQTPQFVDVLTSNLRDELQKSVDRMADYDFTEFNIRQVLEELYAKLSQGVEDTIMALFDKLSAEHSYFPECSRNIHYYNGWKTNKAHKIGRKAIIPTFGVFSNWNWASHAFETYEAFKVLTDIEKVLNYLDDGTTGNVDLHAVLEAASKGFQTRGIECKYFTVDLYKKGTTHIKFRDQAIVDKLNIYGSRRRGWLPPNYGRARYDSMAPDEQAVVDEFQGREAYEKVCADPGTWLVEPQRKLLLGTGT